MVFTACSIRKAFEFLFTTEIVPTEMLKFPFAITLILQNITHALMESQLSCSLLVQ